MVIHWTKLTNWRAEFTYVPPLGGWEVDEWKSQELVCIWAKHLCWRHLRKELVQFILNAGASIETVSYELIDRVSRYSSDYTIDIVDRAVNRLFPPQESDNRSV